MIDRLAWSLMQNPALLGCLVWPELNLPRVFAIFNLTSRWDLQHWKVSNQVFCKSFISVTGKFLGAWGICCAFRNMFFANYHLPHEQRSMMAHKSHKSSKSWWRTWTVKHQNHYGGHEFKWIKTFFVWKGYPTWQLNVCTITPANVSGDNLQLDAYYF